MERSGLRFKKTFAHKGSKISAQKKSFSAKFALMAGFFGIGATISMRDFYVITIRIAHITTSHKPGKYMTMK